MKIDWPIMRQALKTAALKFAVIAIVGAAFTGLIFLPFPYAMLISIVGTTGGFLYLFGKSIQNDYKARLQLKNEQEGETNE